MEAVAVEMSLKSQLHFAKFTNYCFAKPVYAFGVKHIVLKTIFKGHDLQINLQLIYKNRTPRQQRGLKKKEITE